MTSPLATPSEKMNGSARRGSVIDPPEYQAGGPLPEKLDNHPDGRVTWLDRLDHFTLAWFMFPMTTGGLALLLAEQPHTFDGLLTIGTVIYIFNLVLYSIVTCLMIFRFARKPYRIRRCANNHTESLFLPTFFLVSAVVIAGMGHYGVPSTGYWLVVTVRVLYWMYIAVTFLWAVVHYWYLFTASRLTIQSMTPAWILPIFPIMLSGTVASSIAGEQPPEQALPILVAGLAFQGLGFWVAILMYATFISRLMQFGLPGPNLRPGMFITVGPPSFTGLALIGMAEAIPPNYEYFAVHPTAKEALQQLALAMAIFLWALAFWFFCVSLLSCLRGVRKMSFHLVWYACVFPNTGFCIATIQIGDRLRSSTIGWMAAGFTIALFSMYLFIVVCHVRAVVKGDIMWPGKDEDKDEEKSQ